MSKKLLLLLLFSLSVIGQTKEERELIVKDYDKDKLKELSLSYSQLYVKGKEDAIQKAKEMNLPLTYVDEKGFFAELMYFEGDRPVYYRTTNAGAAITTKANRLNSGGSLGLNLNGQNMIVGIWDGGAVRATHQDLVGRVVQKDGAVFTTSSNETAHATHVSGTMMASGFGGLSRRGIAYESTLWANTWNDDIAEATSQAAEGLLLSNHSYGAIAEDLSLWQFGAYSSTSASWDNIMYNAPYYQVVFAAGNDRDSYLTLNPTKNGGDLLTRAGVSKNVLVVGAVNQVDNYTGPSSVVMSDFSNWGPTDDRRIKPDICAKGVGVTSTTSSADDAYSTLNGTSMAAPGVTSSLLLLQQYYNQLNANYMRSATLRALLIHSADEAGTAPGPDSKFGWGLMNSEKAAQIILKNSAGQTVNGAIIRELNLNDQSTYTIDVTADGSAPLVVTMAWTDPAGTPNSNGTNDDAAIKLVNDLDIKVVKNGVSSYPWVLFNGNVVLQSLNNKDNVEKIEVNNPSGTYQIQISHKGTLQGGNQQYSLVVSGINSTLSTQSFETGSVTVFPNPTNDYLNVDSKGLVIKTLELYDMTGRKVKDIKGDYNNTISVDITDFEKGVYMLKISDGESSKIKNIIKN